MFVSRFIAKSQCNRFRKKIPRFYRKTPSANSCFSLFSFISAQPLMQTVALRRYFDSERKKAGVLGQISDESSQSLRKQLIRSIKVAVPGNTVD